MISQFKNRYAAFLLRLSLCLLLLLSVSCYQIFQWLDEEEIVYENSFESAEDARGWEGLTPEMFVSDSAPGSGDQCLNIGGGCIQPTAHLDLPESSHTGLYRIQCWGKVEESYNGGRVVLTNGHAEVEITIRDHEWTEYQSEGALYCPAGQQVSLQLCVGGIVADFMKVDDIRIIRE